MAVTAVLFLVSAGLYAVYVATAPDGASGGSWQGLSFGIAGSGLMIFAGLLSARKKFPSLPIGSAQTWLNGARLTLV